LDLLALSPHPDDAELFCGGTLAELARSGRHVAIADLTRGERASNGSVESRRAASLRACSALGIAAERRQLGLPDAGLDARDREQARRLAELLRSLRPRTLLAPLPLDRHPDHVAAGELTRLAVFLAALREETLSGPPHRVERIAYYICHYEPRRIDQYVDITPSIAAWRAALACYEDQFQRGAGAAATPINEPDFLAQQEARRSEWGRRSGCRFAEAFVLEAPIAQGASVLLPDGGGQ
jgi:bacillithiol biosynthesis deacetylase BshB1